MQQLSTLFASDALFDVIERIQEHSGSNSDIRVTLRYFVAEALIEKEHAFKPWDKEAVRLLSDVCQEYLPLASYLHQLIYRPRKRQWLPQDVLIIRPDLNIEQAQDVLDHAIIGEGDELKWSGLEWHAANLYAQEKGA